MVRWRVFGIVLVTFGLTVAVVRGRLFDQPWPLSRARGALIEVRDAVAVLIRLPRLPSELERLEETVAQLLQFEQERVQLQRENEELRSLLGAPARSRPPRVIGEIFGTVPGSFGSQLLVRLQPQVTAEVGSAVLVQGAAFGRVSRADGNQLVVEPLSSPRTAIAVSIGSRGAVGLLHGENGAVVVDDISAVVSVEPEELIVVAAGDDTYPPGTTIGQVREVIRDDAGLLQRAVVALPRQPRGTTFVELAL